MKKKPDKIDQKDWEAIDSPPLSEDLLDRMRPVKELHPNRPARVRGRQKLPVKTPVSIRLSPEVIQYFKSDGSGWQTKINDVLREYVKSHRVA